MKTAALVWLVFAGAGCAAHRSAADPYLWLEDVESPRSLAWVNAQNTRTTTELEGGPSFAPLRARVRAMLDSKESIPWVAKRGKYLVNLWTDGTNPRGLWRRTTPEEYRKPSPRWETLLDLDALGKAEHESWVFAGAVCLYPAYERCLVSLSRGGADAIVVREFDAEKRAFVTGGFVLPEAKAVARWKDADTLWVATDFGPGSLTDSGYPRIVKAWRRGTPLGAAVEVLRVPKSDLSVAIDTEHDHGVERTVATMSHSDVASDVLLLEGERRTKIDKPLDADAWIWDAQLVLQLRSDLRVGDRRFVKGSLVTTPLADHLLGRRDFSVLFTPTPTVSLSAITWTKNALFLNVLDDVHNTLRVCRRTSGVWTTTPVATPPLAAFTVEAWDDEENDDLWYAESGFLSPETLALAKDGAAREVWKRGPTQFDPTGLEVTQHFVVSKDGTRVPYFQVARTDLPLDGTTPTLIEGYGGFEISLTPSYSAVVGAAWLEKGGVYVVPNLRGGGEYGPSWHQAAVKGKRQHAYDDFAAVARDLIARKVTSPARLGIRGGSNGGLLVGVMMTQHPELFSAVVCEAPLLDMKRYTKLLAGASWIDEFGDPAVAADWASLARYSPYHNVKKGVAYPRVLFTTSTRDDRVHPGHARKMMARMIEEGHDALFYENIEGGHGGAADNAQLAYHEALAFGFLAQKLHLGERSRPRP